MSVSIGTADVPSADRQYLADRLRAGQVTSVESLPLSAQAYLAWGLWDAFRRPVVWVVDGPRRLDLLYQDLVTLTEGHDLGITAFPPREILPGRNGRVDPDLVGDRLKTLQRCLQQPFPAVIVTTVQALLQKTLSPRVFMRSTVHLKQAHEHEPEELTRMLARAGYAFEVEVHEKGQAAVRGGLLDVWPPSEPWPLRIEFFGSVIDSIRTFDPVEQRWRDRLAAAYLTPPLEADPADRGGGSQADLTAFLPREANWVWSDPRSVREHAEHYRNSISDEHERRKVSRYPILRRRIAESFRGGILHVGADGDRPEPLYTLPFEPYDDVPALRGDVLDPDLLEAERRSLVHDLQHRAASGWAVHIFFATAGALERFREVYDLSGNDAPVLHVGALSGGFRCEPLRLMVVSESDLYGRRKDHRGRLDIAARKRAAARTTSERLSEWSEMQPGDLVVHLEHGIGKYLGLYEIGTGVQQEEVLAIEYADGAKLYVPVAQAHLLSRYVGVGKQRPRLHALGGRRWLRDKLTAEKAIRDLASTLLETQAERASHAGHAFPADTHWQHAFEAAFPFQETLDQERAIHEVKEDMERARPMDRLVCGDVGYGKTEVAMRAAFKAVTHNHQVAVLVPTTVLAQQHYDTFSARMEAFPVRVEMLSRFQTRSEQREIVERVRAGQVDIVIGTHRLIQQDVHFKHLGLVIIDEEQRFGVEQKEHLKQLRRRVDVLTLTATPIPRTLYLSLTGARDMSTIQTPPQERLPIETIVTENRDETVREAVLRELNRDGQIYYLHNRVKTIERVRQRLERIVPEARVVTAHGQMPERLLADVMRRFVRGEYDVLLCTTIIESGVDIPNVNTILIERADRFGMADLYQLRGRVGRYKHRAYAYLLLPRHGQLFDTARKRIGAIKRYSSLGAGFKLALRDLEIRGAGNLLGAEQSGHIAAIGFDLYCQLLKRSVARLRGERVPPIIDVAVRLDFIELAPGMARDPHAAVIPSDYIDDETLRVTAYRRIAGASLESEIDALRDEFRDRFGPLPPALERLLQIARIRIVCADHHIDTVEVRGDKLMLSRKEHYLMKHRRFPRLTREEPSERLDEIMESIQTWDAPASDHAASSAVPSGEVT